jgi:DNA recombination protein RmuC
MQLAIPFILATVATIFAVLLFLSIRKSSAQSSEISNLLSACSQKDQEIALSVERLANVTANAQLSLRQNEALSSERDTLRADLDQVRENLALLQGRTEAEENAKSLLKAEFASAAVEALRANSNTFLNLAESRMKEIQQATSGDLKTRKAEIDGLVAPMAKSLKDLDESVRSLRQSEAGLLLETKQLSSALKESKVRGNWGELQLQRIAELSGMQERCDFELQKSILTTEDRRLYPDMVVNLPNHRVIVVDSKASMEAYGESTRTTDPIVQQQKLLEHARAVRKRVDELASKEYRKHVEGSADFVVCFVPGENFFSAALAQDEGLLEYAAAKSVILASPTTLLTILRAVSLGWKEAKLAEDAQEICKLASELYERFRTAADHVKGVGGGLTTALNSYNSFISSVETRVFPQARRLQKLTHNDKPLPKIEPIEITAKSLTAIDWESHVAIMPAIAAGGEEGA